MKDFYLDIDSYTDRFTPYAEKVIDLVKSIDDSAIDFERTNLKFTRSSLFIEIYSLEDEHCQLSFSIGMENDLDGFFGLSFNTCGDVLFDEKPDSDEEFLFLLEFMRHMVTASVNEKQTIIKGKVAKSIFSYHFQHEQNQKRKYTAINRMIWPWEKREIREFQYTPWRIT